MKETVISSVGKIKQTQKTLENSIKIFDDLIISLHKIVDERPNCSLLGIIEKTNNILEITPCEVKFYNFEKSPFTISKTNVIENDIANCVDVKFDTTENIISVNLLTYFGDISKHLTHNSDNIETLDNSDGCAQKKLMTSLQMNKKPKQNTNLLPAERLSNSLHNQKEKNSNSYSQLVKRVHVSHIKSPHEFYVQSELFRLSWDEFHKNCKTEGDISTTPDYIEIDNIYLVISNNTWYRGKIVKVLKNMTYKVFLIDYGISIQIPKQYIRQISDDLKNKPSEATKCTLVGTKIKDNINDGANILMTEIIANNALINMVILKDNINKYIVDLIVTDNFPTSITDALIFTNVVAEADIDKSDKELNRNIRLYSEMKKKLIPSITKTFYRTVLSEIVNTRIVSLNIKNPEEFYVTKYDFKSEIEKISNELNQSYYKNNKKIFLPRLNMPCAVCIKGKWCRARILEVESKLNCTIWLVDYGISEIVSWKQLRVLDEIFIKDNEYSFQCSLIDIEPLQSNNYSWTSEAIKKFKRYMKNSNLKIFVHNTKDFCHKVTLFIVKETVDINVNAKMVNYGFAISTGKESLCAENPIVNNELLSNQNLCIKENNSTELITKIINKFDIRSGDTTTVNENKTTKDVLENKKFNQFRTKIRLTSFISPGEFYIQLEKHLSVINKLQKDIQITQMKKLFDNPGSTIKHNWEINENCLAFTKLCNTDNDILQWYRAIIIHIDPDNDNCTIYLRDYGQTIHNIKFDKIAPIDTLFNTVCNTALKCHLACVRPTGGVESWSHSSIDKLNKLIKKFDIISGCIQGERKNDSTPVILWGMISDNSDALIPNNSEWLNINQILVHNGLAHLVEKFDKGQQDLSYLDKEFAEKEKKNKELWLNDVDDISNDVDNYYKVLGHHNPIINNSLNNIIEDSICFEAFDCSEDLENFVSWLPAQPIKKSIFTAIPTYIDGNGYIYLHDARTAYLLDKIKNNINKKFGNYDICLSEKFSWYVGQPCIARFHLDNLYYRGEIINIKADNIKVCFVDYGNVEDCNPNDLIKDLCLTKIPIQATKYELDGIVPNTEDGKWSRDGLDFIQSLIVMKMCSIRISDISINDLIKKCSIRCQNENIIDIIIENNYAIKKTQVFDKLLQSESNKILKKAISRNNTYRQFFSSSEDEDLPDNSENETDILIRVTATENTETRKDSDYYKKLFETKELENFYSTIISGKESDEKVLDNMDDIFQSTNWQKNIEITELSTSDDVKEINDDVNEIKLLSNVDDEDSVSISSFNPKETSTEISRFDGIDNFTRSELPYCVKDFYCQINYILDGTNFYIHPLLAEHEKVYFDMTRKIQLYAKTASPILEISPKIPCLAVYNEDNLWYRAIIRTHHPNTDTVDVIYVDYLNSDTVPVTKIRKCPHQIIKYPLRLMQVRLSGLRPNPRWRHSDIIRRLSSELLRKRKVYVKVIKNGKIPEVKLLESQTNSSLVLQKLISERFYLLETRKSK